MDIKKYTHLSLLCRLQLDQEHKPCSGGCDMYLKHGMINPCDQPCQCWCHDE